VAEQARESLFSDQWYRVAQRKPRLRSNVRVRRQPLRGQVWYLLVDDATDRSFRIDASAYAFIGRCTGALTTQHIWDAVTHALGDDSPTQGMLLRLMVRLQGAGLLTFDRQADIGSLFAGSSAPGKPSNSFNPLSFKVRLGDPTRVLRALAPVGAVLFRSLTIWVWVAAVLAAALLALMEFDRLAAHANRLMGGTDNLWLLWWIYPPIKLIHELAHGLAVRRWRGEVREWGVAMLVLMPVPYVDASAASGFRHWRRRAVVSAAGIMAELLMAAAAMLVWLTVQPGLVRDIAMIVMVVCSFSTVLVNGNPLLRFDGYFLLTDMAGLPNLATRSAQWWQSRLERHLLNVRSDERLLVSRGETAWLVLYQPLSWLYRMALCLGIVIWLGGKFAFLGYAVGLWFGWVLLLRPVWRALKALLNEQVAESARLRAQLVAAVIAVALPLALFTVPVPDVTVARGVVWLPDAAQVRNETGGFVTAVLRFDGERVEAGEVILRLEDDQLSAERDRLARELEGLQAALFDNLRRDAVTAGQLAKRIEAVQQELARADERIEGLSVRARQSGLLHLPAGVDLPGRFLPQGESIGVVLDGRPTRVRVAVPDEEGVRLGELSGVSVRLAEDGGHAHLARVDGGLPESQRRLPSAALGRPAGGVFDVDPADPAGLASVQPVVWVDLVLPELPQTLSGGRVTARFDHGERSIAAQVVRSARQLFLGRFDPDGAVLP